MLFGIRGEVLLGTQTEGHVPSQTRFGLLLPLKIGNNVAALVAVLSPRGAADAKVVQGGVVLMEGKRRERGRIKITRALWFAKRVTLVLN